jgi:hypothetical protein
MSGILGSPDQVFPQPFPEPMPAFRAPGVIGTPDGPVFGQGGGFANDVAAAAVLDPFRDRFWPKSVISFLVLAAVMTLLSAQFVTPTRRWRPSLPGPLRRLIRRRSA